MNVLDVASPDIMQRNVKIYMFLVQTRQNSLSNI